MKNNNQKTCFSPARRWFIWFLPSFFMFYQYGVQIAPGLKVHYLQTHYLISNFEIALLNTFYIFTYMLLQIPAGLIIDHYDIRKVLTITMLLFTLGSICIFISNHYYAYFPYAIGHLIMGLSASTGFVGSIYLANVWLSKSSYKIAVSLTTAFSLLGVLVVGLIFSFMLTFMNWSQLIIANIIFNLLLALLFWIYIRDKAKSSQINIKNILNTIKVLVTDIRLWLCGIYIAGAFANIVVLTNVWRIDFLENIYHLSRFQATIDNGVSILGFVLGAPFFGYLASKTNKLILLMLLSVFIEGIVLTLSHYFITNLDIKMVLYFIIGFCSGAIVLPFALIREFTQEKMLATAVGLINMIQLGLGMLIIAFVGELKDLFQGSYYWAVTPVIAMCYVAIIASLILLFVTRKR